MSSKFLRSAVILTAGVIFLISIPALAYAQEKETKSDSEKKAVLTITEALEKAWQYNLDFQKASLILDNARIAYKKAKANILQSQSKIDEKQAELNWQEAQNTFEENKNKIEIEIVSSYNNLKYLISLLPLKKKKVQLAQNNLDRVREKIKVGTAGKLEELAAQISLKAARQQLQNTEHQLETAKESSFVATGIENVSQFILTSEFEKSIIEDSLDIYIATALQKRKKIQFARKNVEIAADRLEQLRMTDSPSLDIDKANNDLELFQINLKSLQNSVKSEVRQKYQQLESLNTQLQLLNLQSEQAKRNLENASEQFQAGLITTDELSSKEVSFREVVLELQKSKGNYCVAYLNLQLSAGEELELGEKNAN